MEIGFNLETIKNALILCESMTEYTDDMWDRAALKIKAAAPDTAYEAFDAVINYKKYIKAPWESKFHWDCLNFLADNKFQIAARRAAIYDGRPEFSHRDRIRKNLKFHNYDRVGVGCYSEVWGNKSNSDVIKINIKKDNWPEFIKFSKQLESKYAKYIPTVKKIKFFNYGKESFYVASMEKLKTISCEEYDRLYDNEVFQSLEDKLINFSDEKGLIYDMHQGNVMKRKNGDYVIIDPFV